MNRTEFYRSQCPEGYDPQCYTIAAVISVIATIASTVISVESQQQQARFQTRAANFNAAVAKNNATASAQQAQYEADRIRDRNRRLLGQGRAAFLKSGVDLSGSASDVLLDASVQGELDAAAAIYKGQVSANYSQSQMMLERSRGRAISDSAGLATAGGIIGGIGAAAGSAAGYASNYNKGTMIA